GKSTCKAALQSEMGLPHAPRVPLVAVIGRLDDQKGVDLISAVVRDWAKVYDVQWVVLGTGDAKYHEQFTTLAKRYPQKVAARLMRSGMQQDWSWANSAKQYVELYKQTAARVKPVVGAR